MLDRGAKVQVTRATSHPAFHTPPLVAPSFAIAVNALGGRLKTVALRNNIPKGFKVGCPDGRPDPPLTRARSLSMLSAID